MLFAIVGSSTVLPSAFVPRPPSNVFHFFIFFFLPLPLVLLFLIFLMFIAIAFVAVVAVARCQPHLATLAKVWGEGGTVVSGRSWLARFYGHTTLQNWSNLLRSTQLYSGFGLGSAFKSCHK